MQKIEFSESLSLKEFEKIISEDMKKVLEFFEKELSKLRTNRAHPSLVEDVLVNAYGKMMVLKNVAVITVSDSQTLIIQPFDPSTLSDIEKALAQHTDLGALPRNDGKLLKITLPPMSQTRRQELIKTVSKKHEESLVALRKVRQEVLSAVKDAEKGKKISEDFSQRLQKQLQNTVDNMSAKLTSIQTTKEASLKE